MKKVIIHIGMPKTATTTIQNRILYKAHKENYIHYLGRAHIGKDNYYPIQDEIINPMLYLSDREYEKKKEKIKNDIETIINKIDKEVFVISDEHLSSISFIGRTCSTLRFSKRVKYVFSSFDIEILIVLRSQYDIIHSLYVQEYERTVHAIQTDTFEKYLEYNLQRFPESGFIMYDYYNTISKYINVFSKEKIHVLLYEDLKINKINFCHNLANVFHLPYEFVYNEFESSHENKKVKNDKGTYTDKRLVTRRLFSKWFFSSVTSGNKVTNFLYKLFQENIIIKKMFYYFYMQIFRYKKILNPVFIPKLDEDQRDKVKMVFGKNNDRLSEVIGYDLEKYNYPVL